MTSGFSRTDSELSPALREAARAAAQRAGMTVEEWMRATLGESAAAAQRAPGSIGNRLDQLSQRLGRPAATAGTFVATGSTPADTTARLADTVARLNARLDQLTSGRAAQGDVEQRMSAVRGELEALRRNQSPSISPADDTHGIDSVIAEISARQRALDESEARIPGTATGADLASLQAQLNHMSEQIASLRQPQSDEIDLQAQLRRMSEQIEQLRQPQHSGVDEAIAGLRHDLGEIAGTINEAMPRRALEALQAEVRALGERIDQGYGRGADPTALASIESALGEVVQAINAMTPAEGLGAFEQQVVALSNKLDGLTHGAALPDPEMMHALQAAIHDMRGFAEQVASAEALAELRADVHALAERIDRIAIASGTPHLESLTQRVDDLTRALDTRGTDRVELPQNIEALVHALSDKLDRLAPASGEQVAFDQIERQIARLADRIEVADQRFGNIGTIERGIAQLMEQVQAARTDAVAAAERVARSVASEGGQAGGDVTTIKRDLASLQANQSETERRTQDTLEAVHDTLERLVERLAMVETDIRTEVPPSTEPPPRMAVVPPPGSAAAAKPAASGSQGQRRDRAPIDPDLPADTPLEPGVGARARTPAERIAASEAALPPTKREEGSEHTGKANFIAAARRAAQAAASEGTPVESARAEERKDDETSRPTGMIGRFLADKRRALMIGVAVLLAVYGAVQVYNMMSASNEPPAEPARSSAIHNVPAAEPPPVLAVPAAPAEQPAAPAAANRQSAISPAPAPAFVAPVATQAMISPAPVPAAPPASVAQQADITGSVPQTPAGNAPLSLAAPANSDKLPTAVGGPALRAAAAAGNPAAEYEIGLRYAEGRGVPASQEQALRWFERAAQQGLAPALYRLGSLYEKGQGVKKDLNRARELYLKAGEKGNGKAIHNLAVLYAEGIDGKPDYRTASEWFRKAAARGVADSQYNLGILYARGIGVEQNLAESYKWFSLAANQGDQDAARKRDDVGARLDQQALVAARLAAQTFVVDPSPDDAVNVKVPPGGWDRATATPAKSGESKRKGT